MNHHALHAIGIRQAEKLRVVGKMLCDCATVRLCDCATARRSGHGDLLQMCSPLCVASLQWFMYRVRST